MRHVLAPTYETDSSEVLLSFLNNHFYFTLYLYVCAFTSKRTAHITSSLFTLWLQRLGKTLFRCPRCSTMSIVRFVQTSTINKSKLCWLRRKIKKKKCFGKTFGDYISGNAYNECDKNYKILYNKQDYPFCVRDMTYFLVTRKICK